MAHKLNKHTPDSDDLLKRLDTNDSAGLDDFEKEALEGFASLENPDIAHKLNKELTEKINEVYFEKKQGQKTFFYLSMAAGLILVVGLSFLFYTFFNDQKQELALNKEAELSEKLPDAVSPSSAEKTVLPSEKKEAEADNSEGNITTDESKKNKKDVQPTITDISTKGKAEAGTESATIGGDVLKANNQENNGPITAAQAPVSTEDQKAPALTEKPTDKDEESKTQSGKTDDIRARSTVPVGGLKKKAAKEEAPAKEKRKNEAESETLASDDLKANNAAPKVVAKQEGAGMPGESRNENSLSQPVFAQKNYNKPQDYIKSEIDKNELLKNNVKEFKAKVTIDESGKVVKIKFLTSFKNCSGCEKQVEKILLNMPTWIPAKQGGKAMKEIIHFVYP